MVVQVQPSCCRLFRLLSHCTQIADLSQEGRFAALKSRTPMASLRLNPGQTACPKRLQLQADWPLMALFSTQITDEVQPDYKRLRKYFLSN